jgi:hypothetical protein
MNIEKLFDALNEEEKDALYLLAIKRNQQKNKEKAAQITLNEDEKRMIRQGGSLLPVIKEIRERTGCDLIVAKHAAEAYRFGSDGK